MSVAETRNLVKKEQKWQSKGDWEHKIHFPDETGDDPPKVTPFNTSMNRYSDVDDLEDRFGISNGKCSYGFVWRGNVCFPRG